jgi:signal transduction histidine kinase/CheY-like chemotaxis protein
VLLLAFTLLALGQWASARWLYEASFDNAERTDALARSRHADDILRNRVDFLRRNAADNGNWDEAYAFMTGRNPAHATNTFDEEAHEQLHISAYAFVRMDGRIVDARTYDRAAGKYLAGDAGLEAALAENGSIRAQLHEHAASGGFARWGERFYAWGSAAITRPDAKGPAAGYLVLASELDDAFLAEASQTLAARLTLFARPRMESGAAGLHTPLASDDVHFDLVDENALDAAFPVGLIDAQQLLFASVRTPRPVHAIALGSSRVFLGSTMVFGALLTALALWFVEVRLLRPVQAASQKLARIGESGDLSARLEAPRFNDQVGTLVGAANAMLVQLERQRDAEAARDAAITASRLKSEFLARMSHEIRTPMNGVLGMSELLGATVLTSKQRRFLDIIHRSAESLLHVIDDILDFSKAESGRLDLHRVDFDLRDSIEDFVELLADNAHRKGLDLVLAIESALPQRAHGDPVRLRQILTNLLANAIKFTERGSIVVRVRATAAGADTLRLEVAVIDTGIGIAADALARIFEPFGQADTSVTRRYGGTGLGLPIAQHLAQLMGGDVRVRSEPGRGTRFTFTALLGALSTPSADSDLEQGAARLDGVRILVMDHHPAQREALREQLRCAGARVTTVESGFDARQCLSEAADTDPFDLLVVDRREDEAGGLELVAQVRADAQLRRMPIAGLYRGNSGSASSPGRDGTDVQFTQPVPTKRLIDALSRLLQPEPPAPDGLEAEAMSKPQAELGLHVLLVEDNVVNREVACHMLAALGCTVIAARNGREAVDAFLARRVDLVLMDVQMPVMDGLEATAEIRRLEAANAAGTGAGTGAGAKSAAGAAAGAAAVPIIALTANVLERDRENCLRAGMNGFLSKPFTLRQLACTLAEVPGSETSRALGNAAAAAPDPGLAVSGPRSAAGH